MHDRPVQSRGLIIRSIWAACLLVAGANHARILIQHGLSWDYQGVGAASAAYWSSLTILDPIVAVALLVRPKFGIISSVLLIVTNVAHNLVIMARHAPEGELLDRLSTNLPVMAQIAFLLFVAATAHMAWRDVRNDALRPHV